MKPPSDMTGEELATCVAQEVMGWEKCRDHFGIQWWFKDEGKCHVDKWNPNENWNHTMMVVESVNEQSDYFCLMFPGSKFEWIVEFKEGEESIADNNPQKAILIAALLAVRSQDA